MWKTKNHIFHPPFNGSIHPQYNLIYVPFGTVSSLGFWDIHVWDFCLHPQHCSLNWPLKYFHKNFNWTTCLSFFFKIINLLEKIAVWVNMKRSESEEGNENELCILIQLGRKISVHQNFQETNMMSLNCFACLINCSKPKDITLRII